MTVYVDDMRAKFGRLVLCHMIADNTEELLIIANKIGVSRRWLQKAGSPHEHFDVSLSKRHLAITEGAKEISWRDLGHIIRERRRVYSNCTKLENEGEHTMAKNKRIKTTLTKKQLVEQLVEAVNRTTNKLSNQEAKQLVVTTLDELGSIMRRSIMPGSIGTFNLPLLLKVSLKTRKAIKAGTMVRSPATGGLVPSKGRPKSKSVKIRALSSLKKAAAGEI